jgi:hypothetical protein
MKRAILRRSAERVLAIASYLLPPSQRAWARDMSAELDHVESDAVAFRWAIGCVWASSKERVASMFKLNGPISRPVLVLEWLMCFVPLTLIWFYAVRYIVNFGATADIIVATAFGTLGPIALGCALLATLSKSQRSFYQLTKFLAAAFALMVVLQITNAGASDKLNLAWFKYDLSVFVLLSLLPLAGTLHLLSLSRSASRT